MITMENRLPTQEGYDFLGGPLIKDVLKRVYDLSGDISVEMSGYSYSRGYGTLDIAYSFTSPIDTTQTFRRTGVEVVFPDALMKDTPEALLGLTYLIWGLGWRIREKKQLVNTKQHYDEYVIQAKHANFIGSKFDIVSRNEQKYLNSSIEAGAQAGMNIYNKIRTETNREAWGGKAVGQATVCPPAEQLPMVAGSDGGKDYFLTNVALDVDKEYSRSSIVVSMGFTPDLIMGEVDKYRRYIEALQKLNSEDGKGMEPPTGGYLKLASTCFMLGVLEAYWS